MSACGHPEGFDHGACWWGRFSREGEAHWPPCQKPARWHHPSPGFYFVEMFRWCDEHRHEDDTPLTIAAQLTTSPEAGE